MDFILPVKTSVWGVQIAGFTILKQKISPDWRSFQRFMLMLYD